MEKHDILYAKQYGFRKNYSTSDAFTTLVGEILTYFNEGMNFLSVFIDLKKAFDTVHHPTIIKKMEKLGIRGAVGKWLKSYLSD